MNKMPGMNKESKDKLSMMNAMSAFAKKNPSGEKKLEDFFANIGENPLYAGFKNDVGVHAGMSGKPLMMSQNLWSEISNMEDRSPRRALYIHTPFCLARCKFCSFYQSRTNSEELLNYARFLLKELEIISKSKFVSSIPIDAVYFGGGTPTDHSPSSLKEMLKFLKNNFNLRENCEITMEGRLHGFTDEKVMACLDQGVNRFSFGIQSFDTGVRRQMGRIDSREYLLSRLDEISQRSNNIISVDLIYGLPDQSPEMWLNDLETVTKTEAIDSCSVYNLKFMPGAPIEELVEAGKLSAPASKKEQADLFIMTRQYFEEANTLRPSLRHWAFSPRERSLYNILSKYEETCIPVGVSAGGIMGGYRFFQTMDIEKYYEQIENGEKPIAMVFQVDSDNEIQGEMVGNIEENFSVDFKKLFEKHSMGFIGEEFKPLLQQWHEAGMVNYDSHNNKMTLTPAGEFHNVNISQNLIDYYRRVKSNSSPINNKM